MEPEEVDETVDEAEDEAAAVGEIAEYEAPEDARRNVRTIEVLVEISVGEREFRSRQIVQKLHEYRESQRDLERVEGAFKADKKVRTEALEAAFAEVHALGDTLRSGKENRPVEVHDVWLGEEQRVVTRRIDNSEDVATRPMNRGEIEQWRKQEEAKRQRALFPGVQPEPIAAEGGGAQ
jgi:hypothetical protein